MTRFLANIDRSIWLALVLLALTMVLSEFTGIDIWVQDRFFDFETSSWLIDRKATLPKALFYNGPKIVIIAIAVGLLALTLGPVRWRDRWRLGRRELVVALLTLASGPSLIGFAKATTNVFCPYQIERYGGREMYLPTCSCYPEDRRPTRRGRCFPAGHASGGFALWGMMGLASTMRGRRRFFLLGAGVGGMMGLYQMFKGAHYLSHTMVTICVVWIIFLLWRRLFRCHDQARENGSSFPVNPDA